MRIAKNQSDSFPRFAFVEDSIFTVDSLCFFTGKNLVFLNEVLNSDFGAYYFLKNVAILDNGGFQMRQQYVENMPIPKNIETGNIFEAYNFSEAEIKFIKTFVFESIKMIQSS